jgi:hypothetical protein
MFKVLMVLLLSAMPAEKRWNLGEGHIDRILDEETGVACYIIPANNCFVGKCFYGPAISCVKVK